MPIQILPRQSQLGELLGTGLGAGLQQLAKQKLKEVGQTRGLEALGFSPQEAKGLAALSPELLKPVISGQQERLDQQIQFLRDQQKLDQEQAALQALEGGGALPGIPDATSVGGVSPEGTEDLGLAAAQEQSITPTSEQIETADILKASGKSIPFGLKATRLNNKLSRILKDPSISQKTKELQQKALAKQSDQLFSQQEKIDKKFQPILDELENKKEAAFENNVRLDTMFELSDNVDDPKFISSVQALEDSLGINLEYMYNPATGLFKKLRTDFSKNAKKFFGNKLSTREVELYLDTIPTLMQTPETRKLVIRTLKMFNDIDIIKHGAAEEVLDQYGGYLSKDFNKQRTAIQKPKIDSLLKEFKSQLRGSIQLANQMRKDPTLVDQLMRGAITHGVPLANRS